MTFNLPAACILMINYYSKYRFSSLLYTLALASTNVSTWSPSSYAFLSFWHDDLLLWESLRTLRLLVTPRYFSPVDTITFSYIYTTSEHYSSRFWSLITWSYRLDISVIIPITEFLFSYISLVDSHSCYTNKLRLPFRISLNRVIISILN